MCEADDERVAEIVASFPPLTDEQREKITALLRPAWKPISRERP